MNSSIHYCPHCHYSTKYFTSLCKNCGKYIPGNRAVRWEDLPSRFYGQAHQMGMITTADIMKLSTGKIISLGPIEVPKNNKLKLLL